MKKTDRPKISPKLQLVVCISLLCIIVIAKQFPHFIENYYIPYLQQPIAKLGATLLGWCPFSLGDVIYTFAIAALLYYVFIFLKQKKYKNLRNTNFIKLTQRIITIIIVFNLIWGMAYNRMPFQRKINLQTSKADTSTVKKFYTHTMQRLNELAAVIDSNSRFNPIAQTKALRQAYTQAAKAYPSLAHRTVSLKPSLFSKPLSYMGFHGYYNPITTEAQINTNIPHFFQPIVALHEMAHQLGYAQEDQANFIGFIAAEHSTDTAIQYSYHFDLMLYSTAEVFATDSNYVRQQQLTAHPTLKKHLREWRQFRLTHKSPVATISEWFYNKFLQVNATSKGVASYSDAIHHIIAWRKSVGRIP